MTPKDAQAAAKQAWSKGAIAWMTNNSVAANLLMAVLILGGIFVGLGVKQEVFPEVELAASSLWSPRARGGGGHHPRHRRDGGGINGVKKVYATARESLLDPGGADARREQRPRPQRHQERGRSRPVDAASAEARREPAGATIEGHQPDGLRRRRRAPAAQLGSVSAGAC